MMFKSIRDDWSLLLSAGLVAIGVLAGVIGAGFAAEANQYGEMAAWVLVVVWASLYLWSLTSLALLRSGIEQSLDEASFEAWMKGWFAHGQGVPLGANPWLRFIDEGVED